MFLTNYKLFGRKKVMNEWNDQNDNVFLFVAHLFFFFFTEWMHCTPPGRAPFNRLNDEFVKINELENAKSFQRKNSIKLYHSKHPRRIVETESISSNLLLSFIQETWIDAREIFNNNVLTIIVFRELINNESTSDSYTFTMEEPQKKIGSFFLLLLLRSQFIIIIIIIIVSLFQSPKHQINSRSLRNPWMTH